MMFVLLQSGGATAQSFSQCDSFEKLTSDTVFLAPDTIKSIHIDTLYEYDEMKTVVQPKKKKADISFMCSPQVGVVASRMYPMYNKISVEALGTINGMICYNNLFVDIGIGASRGEQASLGFTRQYTTYHHYTDTLKTILDQYTEIKGKDTILVQVIRKTPVHKTDTLHSDTSFTHKNKYSNVQIPLMLGYCLKTRTTWLGMGIGPSLRITMAQSTNKGIVGDTTFIDESRYFKKLSIDAAAKIFIKQKLSRRIWANTSVSGTVPLNSNYQSYSKQFFRQSVSVTVGIEYYLRL